MEHNVAAVKEVPKDYPISKRQERNGTAQDDVTPAVTPAQQNNKRQENKKASARGRQSAPASNSSTDPQRPRRSATSADKCWVCKKEGKRLQRKTRNSMLPMWTPRSHRQNVPKLQ